MAVDQQQGGGVSTNSSSSVDDPLTWRLDPALSFSDYTIEVIVLPQKKHHCTYHVHKSVLAVGPKKSMYFFRLFQSGFAESTNSTSRTELTEVAAKAFPVMLDYLYNSSNQLFKIEYQDSAPLYHLSDYYEIPSLCTIVETLWQDPYIPCSCLGVLYEHAKVFQIGKLKEAVADAVYCNVKSIGSDSCLAQVSDSALWLNVIEKNGGKPNPDLCALVADYCASNIENMDVYKRLLQEEGHFEVMSIETALKYLELEQTVANLDDGVANGLSDIQSKCIGSLATSWRELDTLALEGSFAKLDHSVVVSIFGKTVRKAKMDLDGPTKIVVSGAGCTAVHGTYTQCASTEGDPTKYKMSGHWNGQDVVFSLFPFYRRKKKLNRWYLSIQDAERPGTTSDNDFYYCMECSPPTEPFPPPVSGWRVCCKGSGRRPAPSLELVYD